AFFEKQVLPILKTRCFKCHGGDKVRGGLRLTSRAAVIKGGDSGPAVDLQNPNASRLLRAITFQDGLEMPPNGQPLPKQIDVLTRWVTLRAPWPPNAIAVAQPENHEGKQNRAAKDYWAYRHVKRPDVPPAKNTAWVRTPIDAFIAAGLERNGLSPAPPAD